MVKLVYLPKTKRWHAFEDEHYCCPIHCRDQICIRVKDRYFPAVSMDSENVTPPFLPPTTLLDCGGRVGTNLKRIRFFLK